MGFNSGFKGLNIYIIKISSVKCNLMFIYLIKCMHARKVSRGKQVSVANGKNEIIKFATLINCITHIVQYQKQILQIYKYKIISLT